MADEFQETFPPDSGAQVRPLHFIPSKMVESDPSVLQWFCLRVAPKQEHVAIAHLRKVYQVDVFCPRLRFQKATRTGRRWYVEALFPSYLFGRFDYLTQHRAVQYCPGVSTIVHFGGKILPVPDGGIEELRRAIPEGGGETITIQSDLQKGQEVQVVEGAFSGLRAVVTQVMPARQRIKVLLEFLGRLSETEVPMGSVLSAVRHPLEGVPETARQGPS